VSKEEYDTCRITNPSPRIIAVCDKPYKLMYFTITFRSFTPQPGGLEFKPGQDYYFISTSSNDDLHRRIGGRCTTHNMKVVFKVCCDPASQPPRDQANGHLQSNGISISLDGSSSTTSTTKFSSISTTPKSSPSTTPSTSTTTQQSTTSLKTTSHKSTGPGTRTKSSGPKAAGTKKETHTSKKNLAVKKEWSGSSAHSFVTCQLSWRW
ncbi:Ephrin-B1, partial [Armadillidium vulgare]